MEIKITRKVQEDGRHMSQIVIPDELWRYAHIRRGLMEALSSAAFDFQGSQEELRVRRPNITLFSYGPNMSLILAENAACLGVEKALTWMSGDEEKDIQLPEFPGYPWIEGEFVVPIPSQEVPA